MPLYIITSKCQTISNLFLNVRSLNHVKRMQGRCERHERERGSLRWFDRIEWKRGERDVMRI